MALGLSAQFFEGAAVAIHLYTACRAHASKLFPVGPSGVLRTHSERQEEGKEEGREGGRDGGRKGRTERIRRLRRT